MRFHLAFPRRQSLSVLLIIRLTTVLLIYGFTRWLFYFVNIRSFMHLNVWELTQLMFGGIRYDLAVISIINLPVILLMTIPFHFRYHIIYQRITNSLFVFLNSFALLFNLIDIIFFRYIAKRTTSEVFAFFGNPAENTSSLLLSFLTDFWYMLLIFGILIWIIYKATTWFISRSPAPIRDLRWFVTHGIIFILFAAITIIFARGGLQLKPISLINAANNTESRNVPLLINSPFSIMQTLGDQSIKPLKYFNESELENIYSPVQPPFQINLSDKLQQLPENPNIVILIVESLGREYIGYYNPEKAGLTPFLDSLFQHSITFNGFANGKRSNEALPSIFTGIPSLMDKEFQATPFIANHLNGLGTVMKKKGYTTAFFHGGNNGTMRFDAFSHIAGFDKYYGRNEYGNDADFDGKWGIYDEPFLKYFANQLNTFQQPFAVSLFTLSSHHPYQLPSSYKNAFPLASNDMEATFSYTDQALRKFFAEATDMEWFNNTIFVITADHTPEKSHFGSHLPYWGLYGVPLAFYIPSVNEGIRSESIAQHADIFPTLAALTKTDEQIVAFGRNLFDSNQIPFAVNYLSGIYQMVRNDTLIVFNGQKTLELYALKDDPKLEHNLLEASKQATKRQETYLKAILQQYNNRLISNQLIIK
ncbi:MAG: sulfatase [Bacteroidetes bacterium]|nr:MAG: sulfatase [Bacteroidota bacterium]